MNIGFIKNIILVAVVIHTTELFAESQTKKHKFTSIEKKEYNLEDNKGHETVSYKVKHSKIIKIKKSSFKGKSSICPLKLNRKTNLYEFTRDWKKYYRFNIHATPKQKEEDTFFKNLPYKFPDLKPVKGVKATCVMGLSAIKAASRRASKKGPAIASLGVFINQKLKMETNGVKSTSTSDFSSDIFVPHCKNLKEIKLFEAFEYVSFEKSKSVEKHTFKIASKGEHKFYFTFEVSSKPFTKSSKKAE